MEFIIKLFLWIALGIFSRTLISQSKVIGNVVDEKALAETLLNNPLFAAGMDVFAVEPPLDSPLLALPNFVGTPHVGGSSKEAILAMGQAAIDNLYNQIRVR